MAPRDLLAPPPALRTLDASHAPYAGVLRASEPPTLWVASDDATDVPWDAVLEEHLLAPVDLARTRDGVALVLPACPFRLVDLLRRRLSIADDEIVTVAVSLLRGCRAAHAKARTAGAWWVTADGRPVLALGGADDGTEEAARILREMTEGRDDALAQAVEAVADAVGDARAVEREQEHREDTLFRIAAPGPLLVDVAPLRARELSAALMGPTVVDVGAHLDVAVAERVRLAIGRTVAAIAEGWERRRGSGHERPVRTRPPGRRRAPMLVGAVVAVVVAVGGILWPAGPDEVAAQRSTPPPVRTLPASAPPPSPPGVTSEADPASVSLGPGAAEAGGDALVSYAACPDEACRVSLREDPARDLPAGAATVSAPGRAIELVDDYGGVAVLRVTAPDMTPQFAVVVAAPAGAPTWLIRDVYDAADQP